MGQLILLVVAAAWAAVLLPPLLRSRVENRPNSSVTDFRRQLNKLQSSVPPRTGGSGMRAMARPLAGSSPLARPAATGRPGQATARRTHQDRQSIAVREHPRHHAEAMREASVRPRQRTEHSGAHRRPAPSRRPDPRADMRRRRTNVLFMLVLASASTLFLAATTKATVMLYLFALSFLALAGYIYLLAQIRQREQMAEWADWPRSR